MRGRKLELIYPLLFLRWRANLHLKPADEHPEIIPSFNIFQSLTTLVDIIGDFQAIFFIQGATVHLWRATVHLWRATVHP